MSDHRHRNHYASRPEAVAEHTYWKLGAPIMIITILTILGYLVQSAVIDIKINIKEGLRQINRNITDIALNRAAIENVKDDIVDIEDVNTRQWRFILTKDDR